MKKNKFNIRSFTHAPLLRIRGLRCRVSHGFTLTELLVVMAIFGLLTTLVIVNFQYGNKNADLRDSATELIQNIRILQSWASSGKTIMVCDGGSNHGAQCQDDSDCPPDGTCGLVPPGGYGIKILDETVVTSYQLFIDIDGCERYNEGEELDNGIIKLKDDVIIKELKIDGETDFATAELVFQPPTSKIYLNAVCSAEAVCLEGGICEGGETLENAGNELIITLQHQDTLKTQDIVVNTISGKIGLVE